MNVRPVAAINQWSCALACLVSLSNENGNKISQEEIITQFSDEFPLWRKQPGALTTPDIEKLGKLLGVCTGLKEIPCNKDSIINEFRAPSTTSIFLGIEMFWNSKGELERFNHIFQVCDVPPEVILLMNPKQHNPELEAWKWDVLDLWKAHPFVLLK